MGSSLLTGCAAGSEEAQDVPTREVTDVEGTRMDVPVEPQRVVTLSEPTLDGAPALGITPVGTVTGRGQSGAPPYLGKAAAEIPELGTMANPDDETFSIVRWQGGSAALIVKELPAGMALVNVGEIDAEGARHVPGFSALTAVRNDQVYVVDGSLWASTGGPLLMRGLVDSVKENLS